MKQPEYILPPGTKIITHEKLDGTSGLVAPSKNIAARAPKAFGEIMKPVPGHGGDVYWVRHIGEETLAPYCFTEFELAGDSREVRTEMLIAAVRAWCLSVKTKLQHGNGSMAEVALERALRDLDR